MPASDDWNTCAAPWKFPINVVGACISLVAAFTRSIASPSATPGARLKETVAEGNCPRWLMLKGPTPRERVATELRGTSVPLLERMYSNDKAAGSSWYLESSSSITQYWLPGV